MNRSAEVNSGLIAVQYPAVQYPSETLLSRLLAFVLWSAGSTMKENTSGNVNSGSRQDLPWTLLMRIWHECRNGNRFVGSRQKKTLRIVESYTGVRRDSNPVPTMLEESSNCIGDSKIYHTARSCTGRVLQKPNFRFDVACETVCVRVNAKARMLADTHEPTQQAWLLLLPRS